MKVKSIVVELAKGETLDLNESEAVALRDIINGAYPPCPPTYVSHYERTKERAEAFNAFAPYEAVEE